MSTPPRPARTGRRTAVVALVLAAVALAAADAVHPAPAVATAAFPTDARVLHALAQLGFPEGASDVVLVRRPAGAPRSLARDAVEDLTTRLLAVPAVDAAGTYGLDGRTTLVTVARSKEAPGAVGQVVDAVRDVAANHPAVAVRVLGPPTSGAEAV